MNCRGGWRQKYTVSRPKKKWFQTRIIVLQTYRCASAEAYVYRVCTTLRFKFINYRYFTLIFYKQRRYGQWLLYKHEKQRIRFPHVETRLGARLTDRKRSAEHRINKKKGTRHRLYALEWLKTACKLNSTKNLPWPERKTIKYTIKYKQTNQYNKIFL